MLELEVINRWLPTVEPSRCRNSSGSEDQFEGIKGTVGIEVVSVSENELLETLPKSVDGLSQSLGHRGLTRVHSGLLPPSIGSVSSTL